MVKLQEKPLALKREHPALQNMKFLHFFYFCGSFFSLLNSYPDSQCGSRSSRPKSMQIYADPDEQHRLKLLVFVFILSRDPPSLTICFFQTFFVKAKLPQIKDVGELPFLDRSVMLSGDTPR
jgi:hypothetical protein